MGADGLTLAKSRKPADHHPYATTGPDRPFATGNDAAPRLSKAAVHARRSNATRERSAPRTFLPFAHLLAMGTNGPEPTFTDARASSRNQSFFADAA